MAEDYTYIVSRLRAIEAALPDAAWFQRLSRTPLEGLLGALREFYPGFEGVGEPHDFERGIETERTATLDLVTSLLTEGAARSFLRSGYDFDNCIMAWKAARLGVDEPPLAPWGTIPPEIAAKGARREMRGALPEHLERLIAALERSEAETKSLAAADYAGQNEKWAYLLAAAPGAEARGYVRILVDLANIKTFVRLRRIQTRREAIETVWIAGGEIDTARLRALYREAEEEFLSYLATTSYRRLLRLGLTKETELWRIETMLRRHLLDALGESRYRSFDFSPVLYHLELRERDFQLLRTIIVGRINRQPDEILGERVASLLPS